MKIFGGWFRSEKFGGCVECLALFCARFYPDLVEALLLPVGEQTNAVCARFDLVKVIFDLGQRQVFVHILAHREGRLNIESDLGDYTNNAKANDGSSSFLAVLLAGEFN